MMAPTFDCSPLAILLVIAGGVLWFKEDDIAKADSPDSSPLAHGLSKTATKAIGALFVVFGAAVTLCWLVRTVTA